MGTPVLTSRGRDLAGDWRNTRCVYLGGMGALSGRTGAVRDERRLLKLIASQEHWQR